MTDDPALETWFLPGTPWTAGNRVRPLVHGATYFRVLHDALQDLRSGDRVFFTDWRGDPDQRLLPEGPTVVALLCSLLARGVEVRGLVWRSHSDLLRFSSSENHRFGRQLNAAGAEVLLDQRVRSFGSHHQKLVVLQHAGRPERDVAFVGGIDLCHSRRDDADHRGDPQPQDMDERYGPTPPWHDAMLELHGPVVAEVLRTFGERWDDPAPLDRRTPYRVLLHRLARMPLTRSPMPTDLPTPPPAGPHAVQLLRTYGRRRPAYPFAPHGERTVAAGYNRAFALGRGLLYLEDQYLWSVEVAQGIADALREQSGLHLVALVPRYPDVDDRVSGPANRLGQVEALRLLKAAAPDRVGVYDLENRAGTPVYVHAKVCVIDDLWATCGSDNVNRRSWTHDSELTCAVLDPTATGDGGRRFARDLRLQLWAEHLEVDPDDPRLVDARAGFALWQERARALDAWHAGGRRGPRPPGRVRVHEPEPVGRLQRLWSAPLYRTVFDPDGRPRRLRRRGTF